VGNPLISQELVRDHVRMLERDAADRRRASSALTDHLAAARMFSACGKKELRAIAKVARAGVVAKGTTIMTEGEDGNSMYVILSGSAKVSRNGRSLATLGPGDTAGELALLTKGPRSATVVATSDLEVAIISRKAFSKLLASGAPGFSRKLLESLANVIRELDKKVV
jgi:CRP-like cAMP-binding protein